MTESSKDKPADDIQRLRNIVLGEEKDRLHQLERRVTDLESRTRDVAEVLPSAMSRLVADPASLPAIEKPVVTTIRGAIKRDTASFAEALFPVLGPAIRRAVADALRSLVQRINAALEHSFTIKGLKWRLEAARTGVPFAQVVLRHTMLYAVQEAFLIQRNSGLILAGVHRDEALALDEDAVAAMLTAIQSFIQDSFGMDSDEPLRSAELGDRTMWIFSGPNAVLACVISGTPPGALRAQMMSLLETLHARFGLQFAENSPGLEDDDGLLALLGQALREEADESASPGAGRRYKLLWIMVGVLLLVYLLYTSFNSWQERKFSRQVRALFDSQAGYVVTSAKTEAGILKLSGLRDPVTAAPSDLLESHQVTPERVLTDFSPYQSLDPALVTRRLQQRLALAATTRLELDNDILKVIGNVNSRQLASLAALPQTHDLVRRVDVSGISLEFTDAEAMVRAALDPPGSIEFLARDNRMLVDGTASAAWYAQARDLEPSVPGWEVDFGPLENLLSEQLNEWLRGLDGQVFYFSGGTRLTAESRARLDALAAQLLQTHQLAAVLNRNLSITLEGSSDGIGDAPKNSDVAMARARQLRGALVSRGIEPNDIALRRAPWQQGDMDMDKRKVTLMVSGAGTP